MDGGATLGEVDQRGTMGREQCHVLQDDRIQKQLLEVEPSDLPSPQTAKDVVKFCHEICGWFPDSKVQYRKPEKLKNHSSRPNSGKKSRTVNQRDNFQFIHYSDPRRYIEQYRRLHTSGGPLEKLTHDNFGREKTIYYAPLEYNNQTQNGTGHSSKAYGTCPKCARHEGANYSQNRKQLHFYSPRETNITFEFQSKQPSVTQYRPVYNHQTGITYETNDFIPLHQSGSGSTSRGSSAETPTDKYSFHNGPPVSLPNARLCIATSTATTAGQNTNNIPYTRATSRQSPPQNGFSIDRSLSNKRVVSITGHTPTECDHVTDMTATGYNIMTVDRKEQESLPDEKCKSKIVSFTRPCSILPVAVGVKMHQAPRAQSAYTSRRTPHTTTSSTSATRPQTAAPTESTSGSLRPHVVSISSTSSSTDSAESSVATQTPSPYVRSKAWSAGAVSTSRGGPPRLSANCKRLEINCHPPSICEGVLKKGSFYSTGIMHGYKKHETV